MPGWLVFSPLLFCFVCHLLIFVNEDTRRDETLNIHTCLDKNVQLGVFRKRQTASVAILLWNPQKCTQSTGGEEPQLTEPSTENKR